MNGKGRQQERQGGDGGAAFMPLAGPWCRMGPGRVDLRGPGAGWGAASRIGLRQRDEDWVGGRHLDQPVGRLMVLCDGMGGGTAGDEASAAGGRAFLDAAMAGLGAGQPPVEACRSAVAAAEAAVQAVAEAARGQAGSTLTAVWAPTVGPLIVTHLGDSRAYLVRGGVGRALTADHTVAGDMLRAGYIQHDELATAPGHHVLTRSLGRGEVEPDVLTIAWEEGDRVLLVCDGVWGPLHGAGRLEVPTGAPEAVASSLVDAALVAGSRDNCTAAVLER